RSFRTLEVVARVTGDAVERDRDGADALGARAQSDDRVRCGWAGGIAAARGQEGKSEYTHRCGQRRAVQGHAAPRSVRRLRGNTTKRGGANGLPFRTRIEFHRVVVMSRHRHSDVTMRESTLGRAPASRTKLNARLQRAPREVPLANHRSLNGLVWRVEEI